MENIKFKRLQQATLVLNLTSVFISMVLLFVAIFNTRQFFRLEERQARAALERVQAVLDYEQEGLGKSAADYSRWDETWQFMKGNYPDYPEDNITPEVLDNLGVQFSAFYDVQGNLFYYYTPEAKASWHILPTIPPELRQNTTGLLILEGTAFLVGFQTIVHSDGSGPNAGYLVFGKVLGPEVEKRVSRLSGADFHCIPAEHDAEKTMPGGEPQIRFTQSTVQISSFLSELRSQGGMNFTVEIRRDLFQNGFRSVSLFFMLGLLIILVLLVNYNSSLQLLSYEKTIASALEQEVAERTKTLQEANDRLITYKNIVKNTSEGILISDLTGKIQETNPAMAEMSGYSEAELVGKSPRLFKSDMHNADFYAAMWKDITTKGRWEGEIWNRNKDGSLFPYWLSIDTLKDVEGNPSCYIAFYIDIAQLKQTQEKLNNLAFFDSLTGLPNRALFMDRIDQVLSHAYRDKSRFALLYMDLDHFKDVNDGYGHQAGDELLILAAHRIKAQVRDADTVCRLGGDEFTVILETIQKSSDAGMVAKKIIDALRQPFVIHEQELYIGCSVGIALYPYDGATVQELVKNADSAMYDAKEQGRGQYRFATGAAGISSRQRIEVEASIRKAMDENRLFLCYQPLVSAGSAEAGKSRGIIGAEALIRIRHTNNSVLPPSQFISVAEDTGLIIPMGGWALIQACRDAKEWELAGKPLQVSVNVSQRQFEGAHIIKQTKEALQASGLDPQWLKIEVTESLFMRDTQRVAAIMEELKRLGVGFAVDDFGTGYSSLRYIDSLPIESLKIDKSFVDHLRIESGQDQSRQDGSVALAVVSMARSFGLVSIAEGVETMEQLEALKRRGCDAIQGYLISKPLPSDLFKQFLLNEEQTFASDPADLEPNRPVEEIEELESI